MASKYAIGIDLGTTNCVLAYRTLEEENAEIKLLEVPQASAASTIENRYSLPSFCYLATEAESAAAAFSLPWDDNKDYAVGELARRQSADVPGRTVAAAKSWLAHSRVDRRDAILPWNAPEDVKKISPVEASRRYLRHLVDAWNNKFPQEPLALQQVVLTVPASFDASARELTMEAARLAGLPESLVLLEEPQAAVYAWLADVGDGWRKKLRLGDNLLVFDVGGGTTDFTLIGVEEENGELTLKRIAVGNHILVGGDNMDLTIAHVARNIFADKGINLDPWQSVALWHSCRAAKEHLLSEDGPQVYPVTILGRGSKLIGGTVTAELSAEQVKSILAEGFFPICKADAVPVRKSASGFRELGLAFESDAAVTRHLANFLRVQGQNGVSVQPSHVLFNGGVFKADIFKSRTLEAVKSWFGEDVESLEQNPDLDYSVARGASFYAFVKQGKGLRIRGGAARSYYVGIETSGPAVPGMERPLSALCVVPFGMEEGSQIDVPSEEIGLVVGEPAKFRFFSSSVRHQDTAGTIVERFNDTQIEETDSLEADLPADEKFTDMYVPVLFQSRITELGVFELWCRSTISDDSWKLEFSVRENQ
ncbi:MAG: Hsp70 family protein [Chitinispirillales bacterium]|jgi:molecular chaperone DnaK (HSP70)|nr:Hsp70 family protein [Chitinispirillales bacterium]